MRSAKLSTERRGRENQKRSHIGPSAAFGSTTSALSASVRPRPSELGGAHFRRTLRRHPNLFHATLLGTHPACADSAADTTTLNGDYRRQKICKLLQARGKFVAIVFGTPARLQHVGIEKTERDLAAKIAQLQDQKTLTVHNQIFFTNILRILDEQGMTKNELADRAGMSVSFLSDLTNGKANPSLKIMESLAEALDTPLATLLETTDLSDQDLEQLAGGKPLKSLPSGFVRVTAVLTEYQAFQVRQWDRANSAQLAEKAPKKKG